MPDSSRRTFLALAGAGAAAAGTAAVLPAASAGAAAPNSVAPNSAPAHPGPLVAHVRDTGSGEIALYVDDREVVVHDKDLAHRIASLVHTAR